MRVIKLWIRLGLLKLGVTCMFSDLRARLLDVCVAVVVTYVFFCVRVQLNVIV